MNVSLQVLCKGMSLHSTTSNCKVVIRMCNLQNVLLLLLLLIVAQLQRGPQSESVHAYEEGKGF